MAANKAKAVTQWRERVVLLEGKRDDALGPLLRGRLDEVRHRLMGDREVGR
jgi:hypothetical protein